MRGRVLKFIEDNKLNISALAEMIGTKQTTISGWRAGKTPDAESLSRLPAALGVSGHWLLTGDGQMMAPGKKELEPYEQARIEVSADLRRQVQEAVTRVLRVTSRAGANEKAVRHAKVSREAMKRSLQQRKVPPAEGTG